MLKQAKSREGEMEGIGSLTGRQKDREKKERREWEREKEGKNTMTQKPNSKLKHMEEREKDTRGATSESLTVKGP